MDAHARIQELQGMVGEALEQLRSAPQYKVSVLIPWTHAFHFTPFACSVLLQYLVQCLQQFQPVLSAARY